MRYVLFGVVFLLALAAAYLLLWPIRIEPVAVTVGPNPGFTGAYAQNDLLRRVQWLAGPLGPGPEDVAIKDGYAYTGLEDGRIVRVRIDGQSATGPAPLPSPIPGAPAPVTTVTAGELFATTGGRPLGVQFDPYNNLVVADARKGLLAITPQGRIVPVKSDYQGIPMRFVDDLDIAKDGTIYFTDASKRFGIDEYSLDFFEGQATGRLFAFSPASGRVEEKVSGLAFANGVALGPDEEYVLVNETAASRITRYWLKGSKAGQKDTFIENLPGYPDNLSFNGRDIFWVALAGPRSKALESSMGSPFFRKVAYRLQMLGLMAAAAPDKYGCIVAINTQGVVVATLQDPGGLKIHTVTSVNEKDGLLYIGGLQMDRIATIPVPPKLLGGVPLPPH
ncbi:MAG: SMP-30/gluconolactonase/LRE family protein [Micropepsaceae bacterium]